jgi:hypothetical protein
MFAYQLRPIRFIELMEYDGWKIKLYSISSLAEFVSGAKIEKAKQHLGKWLELSQANELETYQVATLILHECKEGCFVVINWWIDENMLQHYVYLAGKEDPENFKLFSDKGIVTCVWESAVIWFERNAWVKHILMKSEKPDFEAYLHEQLNQDV